MNKILIALIVVIILAAVYIFYNSRIETPSSDTAAPTSTFQGPPPGSTPFVQGPTSTPSVP